MRATWRPGVLALALLPVIVVLVACGDGGNGTGDASSGPVGGGLPPNFPDDFPIYPGLDILESSPLGGRYVIRADSGDPPEDIVDFYEEELVKEPWELLEGEAPADPNSTLFRFTAPGWPMDGRLQVTEVSGEGGRTIVGIAVPIDIEEGD